MYNRKPNYDRRNQNSKMGKLLFGFEIFDTLTITVCHEVTPSNLTKNTAMSRNPLQLHYRSSARLISRDRPWGYGQQEVPFRDRPPPAS